MARIIENNSGIRRIIKLSTSDILSVVREYQQITHKYSHIAEVKNILDDIVIYIPEDV